MYVLLLALCRQDLPPKTTLLLCVVRMRSFVFTAHLLVERPGIGGDGVLQSPFFFSFLFFPDQIFFFFSHTESLQSYHC